MPSKNQKNSGLKLFVGLVVAMVAAVIVLGLYVAGSPSKERERQLDNQRVNELTQISNAVDTAFYRDGHLPQTLDELTTGTDYYLPSLKDPKTGVPYEYRTTGGDTYELCAVFDAESQKLDQYGQPVPVKPLPATRPMMDSAAPSYPGYRDWTHPAGRHCFPLTVETRMPTQTCSLTNPCQAGQTCAQLPDRKGTYCVPAGKECLAAGCPEGKCTVMESYPAQVRCTTEATQ